MRASLAILVLREHEHVIAGGILAESAGRYGDGVARGADRNAHAHGCAGDHCLRRMLDARANGRVARVRIDARVDRQNRGDDRCVTREHLNLSATAELRGDALCDGEVHVHIVIDALERGDLRAFVQVLAGMHVGEADAGAERRANRLALDDGLDACHLGAGDVALRDGLIQLHLRDGALFDHPTNTVEVYIGEVRLGIQRSEIGFLDRNVQRYQHRTRLDDSARLQCDLAHRARNLVT
jgi:hypothetical protein